MKKYILDASVILTFLLGNNLKLNKSFITLLKENQKGNNQLYSIALLPLEVGNGLRYSLDEENLAKEALVKFLKLPVKLFSLTEAHYQKILLLSYQLKTSFYDTSYHWTAKLLKGIFLTCDKDYFKKAKQLGSIKLL